MFADDPEVIATISEWVQKAENDLVAATHLLKLGQTGPNDMVCFHAQQCIEKYLKALLINLGRDFPRTHNIRVILNLLPANLRPDLTPEAQQALTDYATTTRYPGDYGVVSYAEAKTVVKLARQVRKFARQRLPKLALRRKAQ
jgi:HEPN domain-containing protein